MHFEYWAREKKFLTYLMIYNMMEIMYREDAKVAIAMDDAHVDNLRPITMNRNGMNKANSGELEEFLNTQHIHKLSWKWWGRESDSPLVIHTEDGELTWFGYLYKKNIDDFNSTGLEEEEKK